MPIPLVLMRETMATNEELPVKTILIVEDDPSIGEMFLLSLVEESIYNPVLVRSGAQALEVIEGI